MDLRGQRAIVTGGAIRIGRAISLALARSGCDLLLHYGRSAAAAEETAREARSNGVRVAVHAADLGDLDSAHSVVPTAIDALGGVDILVNSAAIFPEGGLLETDVDGWQEVFDINLRAPYLLSQAFARHRVDVTGGREEGGESAGGSADGSAGSEAPDAACVVNILDARTFRPGADHFAYRLTKAALHAMTEGLALELAPAIRVNGVALGAILPPPGESPAVLDRLVQERVPLRRPGSPEAVADCVVHLLEQPFLTGVTIRLDGAEFL